MTEGKPITSFVVTALVLWIIYLWRAGRLGRPGMLPHPTEWPAPSVGPVQGPPIPGGWRPGAPPIQVPPLVIPKPSDVGPLQMPGQQQGGGSVLG